MNLVRSVDASKSTGEVFEEIRKAFAAHNFWANFIRSTYRGAVIFPNFIAQVGDDDNPMTTRFFDWLWHYFCSWMELELYRDLSFAHLLFFSSPHAQFKQLKNTDEINQT